MKIIETYTKEYLDKTILSEDKVQPIKGKEYTYYLTKAEIAYLLERINKKTINKVSLNPAIKIILEEEINDEYEANTF